ncbi:MAG: PASTA domain-containing protein [Micromonosporaceae bacterium]
MSWFSRDNLTRTALGVGVLIAVLLASFGIGYRSSEALLDGAGAYLQRGHSVVHVNAESGTEDAETARKLATGEERLQVVQVGPDSVWVVNTETGEVWRLPTDTMKPEKVGDKRKPGAKQPDVVTGGGEAYLVDRDTGEVTALDPRPDKRRKVETRGTVDEAVVDSKGVAWALSRTQGELYRIAGGEVRREDKVAEPGESGVRVTLVADRPVVYRPAAGEAATYSADGLVRKYHLPQVSHPVLVPSSPVSAPTLIALVSASAMVYTVDLGTGKPSSTQLTGREGNLFGPPAVLGNLVYLADQTQRQVVRLELRTLRQRDPVKVENGTGQIDVFVRDGRVWVNDPYAPTMLVFDRHGNKTEVDRSGKTVTEAPKPEPPKPPKAPSAPDAKDAPDAPDKPTTSPNPEPTAEKVTVPDVVGMDRTKACEVVQRARLVCKLVSRQAPQKRTGEVVETDPKAGRELAVGSEVLVYYAGPAVVPDVVGKTVEEACEIVEKAGFTCSKSADGVAGSPSEINKVYGQQPAKGTAMSSGTPVVISYPVPGWIKVPQVVNLNPQQASETLQAYGLGEAPNPNEAHWQPNVVHSQSTPPGTAVQQGTAIGYAYQDSTPYVLDRWKLDKREVRYMAPRGQQPPPIGNLTWHPQTEYGGVYLDENDIPGELVTVHRFRCYNDCGDEDRDVAFFFKASTNPPSDKWRYDGPAFACFRPDGTAPEGTRALVAMKSEKRHSWAFAPYPSGEYDFLHSDNHGAFRTRFTVCHMWFGPGTPYRPNG